MTKWSKELLVRAALLVAVTCTHGCLPLLAAGAANRKTPPAQTEASCKAWECWDGYKCDVCPQEAESEPKKK